MSKHDERNIQQQAWKQAGKGDEVTEALEPEAIARKLEGLDGWQYRDGGLRRDFGFEDFSGAMGFANVVAWIADAQDHHPDLEVSYGNLQVRYRTHSADGITEKDFVAAARLDTLYAERG
jgi:4a-hydroxytetrahydrobiopterin dehydratase